MHMCLYVYVCVYAGKCMSSASLCGACMCLHVVCAFVYAHTCMSVSTHTRVPVCMCVTCYSSYQGSLAVFSLKSPGEVLGNTQQPGF